VVTTVFFVVTIHIVVITTEIVTKPQQFWFAEAVITKRFAEATKSFSPCVLKKIVPIYLKLNFTPNTLGCYGL